MWGRRAALAVALVAGTVAVMTSCLDPTEVTLVLTTDQPCAAGPAGAQSRGTQIFVGGIAEAVARATAPAVQTAACAGPSESGASSIGTLVLTPSGDKSAHFVVEVVMGVTRPVEECATAPPGGHAYDGCIVARRQLAFTAHTPLTLPIDLRGDCAGIACDSVSTCERRVCVPSVCPSESDCSDDALYKTGADAATARPDDAQPSDGPLPDAAGGDGLTPEAGGCSPLGAKVIFVTSQLFTAPQVGGLSNADQVCASIAASAGLPGTYGAWLSDETKSAGGRLTYSTVPYVLPDRTTVVACSSGDFFPKPDAAFPHAVDQTEDGTAAPTMPGCGGGGLAVWTGTFSGGAAAFDTCGGWTDAGGTGVAGIAQASDNVGWTEGCGGYRCNKAAALYCMQQ